MRLSIHCGRRYDATVSRLLRLPLLCEPLCLARRGACGVPINDSTGMSTLSEEHAGTESRLERAFFAPRGGQTEGRCYLILVPGVAR